MYRRIGRAVIVILLVALCAGAERSQAQDRPIHPLPLEVAAGGIQLRESLFARQRGDTIYFPLRALADALDFVIEIKASDARARGWFLAEDRRVSFDARTGEVVSEGERRSFDSSRFLTDELDTQRELYVAREVLAWAWPVGLKLDMAALRVDVAPEEHLPVQARKERADRRERLLSRRGRNLDLTPVDGHYRLWRQPSIDITAEGSSRRGDRRARQEIDWAHDFLSMGAEGRVVTSQDGTSTEVNSVRLTLRRADLVEPLPGPLKNVQVGDVSRQALTSIGGLGRGRGIVLSSFPIERAEQFDTTTIEGNAPSNYEVELFRNGRLLRFQRTGADGRYEFEDVPLLFGNNRFRVVLHGPQGQTRERLETINTGRALARPGQTIARMEMVDVGTDLLPVGDQTNGDRAGLSATGILAHGLTRRTSLFGAVTNLPTRQGTRQYAIAGFNAAVGRSTTQMRVLGGTGERVGVELQTLSRIGPVRVNFSSAYFDGFESPDVGFDGNATRLDAELRTNTRLDLGFTNVNLGVDGSVQEDVDGSSEIELDTSQRLRVLGVRINHDLRDNFGDRAGRPLDGNLSTSLRLRPFNLRTGLSYEIPLAAQDLRLSGRYRGDDSFSVGADVRRDFDQREIDVGLDLTRRFGPVLASLTGGWQENDGFTAGLRVTLGLSPRSNGGYRPVPQGVTNNGAVRARAFVDRDADGERDPDEAPVEGVRFGADARGTAATDEDGEALVQNFQALRTSAISVRERSLDNPFWLPRHEGYSIVPRPGVVQELDIPINETGAIDGTVKLAETDEPMSGVPLKLVAADGDTEATTTSSYGGFFAFDQVRYGNYKLELGDTGSWTLKAPVAAAIGPEQPVDSRNIVAIVPAANGAQ